MRVKKMTVKKNPPVFYAQERIAPVALCSIALFHRAMHGSKSLVLLFIKEQLWAKLYFALSLKKNEQFAQKTKEQIPDPAFSLIKSIEIWLTTEMVSRLLWCLSCATASYRLFDTLGEAYVKLIRVPCTSGRSGAFGRLECPTLSHLFLAILLDTLSLVQAGQPAVVALIQPPVLHHLQQQQMSFTTCNSNKCPSPPATSTTSIVYLATCKSNNCSPCPSTATKSHSPHTTNQKYLAA